MKEGVKFSFSILLVILVLAMVGAVDQTINTTNGTGAEKSIVVTNKNTTQSPLIPSNTQTSQISPQTESVKVEQAYSCLQNLVVNKSTFSLEEAAFGVLALGAQDKLIKTIQSTKSDREACWPKVGCTIRDTSLVALAYQRAGIPTADIEQWLQSKRITPRELTWYLEVDTTQHESSSCTIKYDGRSYTVNIQDDMKFNDAAGICLQRSASGYWMTIVPSCLGKVFEVSCDKDFITTLIYQKNGGDTVYVSSETHAAASLGTTSESVNVSCLSTGGGCDYQGTLWATYVLHKLNKNTAPMLPYLVALADDTTKYFPSAFIFMLTRDLDKEYYGQIIQQRKQNQFWEFVNNGYTRFYDTSIGVLALSTGSGENSDVVKTQAYLLSVQTKDGCWNNNHFRDSAFILYSSWPKTKIVTSAGSAHLPQCSEGGFSCERLSECLESGGVKHSSYECQGGNICCSVKVQKQSCANLQGSVCNANEQCIGSVSASGDGQCCIGSCSVVVEENACESAGGVCSSSCGSDEKEASETCPATNSICCVPDTGKGISWFWIILLLILIAAVVFAIMKRDAIKLWWFKKRGKTSSTPMARPGFPPNSGGTGVTMRPQQRMIPPQSFARSEIRPQMRPTQPSKDREIEETMRKLKEMSG